MYVLRPIQQAFAGYLSLSSISWKLSKHHLVEKENSDRLSIDRYILCNFENQYFCSRAYLLFYVFAGKKDLKLWWKQKVQNLWGGEKERDRGHQILKSHLHCLICVRWWNHLINICTLHATMLWNPEKVTFFPRLLVSLITYVRSYNHSWFRLWFFVFVTIYWT